MPRKRNPLISVYAPAFGGAAAAFSPDDVSGLVAWYDFSDTSLLFQDSGCSTPVTADGDPIGCIQDKSSAGNNATQATTAKKPTFKTPIQNSRGVGQFDGGDVLYLGSEISTNTVTAFAVFKPVTGVGGYSIFGGANASGGYSFDVSSVRFRHVKHNSALIGTNDTDLSTVAFSSANGTYQTSDGAYSMRLNGAADGSGNTIVAFTNGTQSIGSQRYPGGADQGFFQTQIAELLFYDEVLIAGNIASVETYLNSRWAVY